MKATPEQTAVWRADWKKRGLCVSCGAHPAVEGYVNCVKCRTSASRRIAEAKDDVLEHYGRECACCSERHREFLTIDHIAGGGKAHRKIVGNRGGWMFYKWLKKNGYPAGYRILCFNCNSALGAYGYCPHGEL